MTRLLVMGRELFLGVFLLAYAFLWVTLVLGWLHGHHTIAGGLQALSALVIWLDLVVTVTRNLARRRAAAARAAQEGGQVLAAPLDTTASLFLLLLLSLMPFDLALDSTARIALQVVVLGVMVWHAVQHLRQRTFPVYRLGDEGLRMEFPGARAQNLAWEKIALWGRLREGDWKAYCKEHDVKPDAPPKRALWLLAYREGRRLKFVQLRVWPELSKALSERIGAAK